MEPGRTRLLSMDMGARNVAYLVVDTDAGGATTKTETEKETKLRVGAWGLGDVSGDLIPNTVALAGRLAELHGPFDLVALENQLGRFAAGNKTVQSVLHASMLLLCPGCEVVNVSPQCKTALARKLLGPEALAEIAASVEGKSSKRASYVVQKQTVVRAAFEFLSPAGASRAPALFDPPGEAERLLEILEGAAKKDDLCDCLLQALSVLERRGHVVRNIAAGAGRGEAVKTRRTPGSR